MDEICIYVFEIHNNKKYVDISYFYCVPTEQSKFR